VIVEFKEPETFKTPDKEEYMAIPVTVDGIEPLHDLMDLLNRERKKHKGKMTKEEEGLFFLKEGKKDLNKIIDTCVINTKTGEPLPTKWRQIGPILQIIGSVMDISSINTGLKVDDNPLERKKK
jgi:hypothetical protein